VRDHSTAMMYFVQNVTGLALTLVATYSEDSSKLEKQVYNANIRKLYFQANLCEVFVEDRKQHYCGDLGWADLLFMKSSRIIILLVCRQAIPLLSRSVNLIAYH